MTEVRITGENIKFELIDAVAALPPVVADTVSSEPTPEPATPLWSADFSGSRWQDNFEMIDYHKPVYSDQRSVPVDVDGETGIRVFFPKGKYGKGLKFHARIPPGDSRVLRYKVRFEDGFDFAKGGKLFGLSGGKANVNRSIPTGRDGFSVRPMWMADGRVILYVYHPDMKGPYGDNILQLAEVAHFRFVFGKAHDLRLLVKMNTVGQRDGAVELMIDGRTIVRRNGLRFRDVNTLTVDRLHADAFPGGGTNLYAPNRNQHVDIGAVSIHKELS